MKLIHKEGTTMFARSRYLLTCAVAACVILVFETTAKLAPPLPSRSVHDSSAGLPISVVIWTDHGRYAPRDSLQLSASLKNSSDSTVYVDRRMFWTGFGGGLKLEIKDDQGYPLPARPLSDAIMPPPKEDDTTILVRLDEGFFY